jgi:hypothetical protein
MSIEHRALRFFILIIPDSAATGQFMLDTGSLATKPFSKPPALT